MKINVNNKGVKAVRRFNTNVENHKLLGGSVLYFVSESVAEICLVIRSNCGSGDRDNMDRFEQQQQQPKNNGTRRQWKLFTSF